LSDSRPGRITPVERTPVPVSVYPCNENQLDVLFFVSSFRQSTLHVSGIFVAHHQEVYCTYTIGTCCAFWCPFNRSMGKPRAGLDVFEKINISCFWGYSNPVPTALPRLPLRDRVYHSPSSFNSTDRGFTALPLGMCLPND